VTIPAHVFLPVLKCVEKWLTKIFHWFRSETNAKDRAVPTIDLPADELAAVTAAIRGVI
jgi:hypothetical protein